MTLVKCQHTLKVPVGRFEHDAQRRLHFVDQCQAPCCFVCILARQFEIGHLTRSQTNCEIQARKRLVALRLQPETRLRFQRADGMFGQVRELFMPAANHRERVNRHCHPIERSPVLVCHGPFPRCSPVAGLDFDLVQPLFLRLARMRRIVRIQPAGKIGKVSRPACTQPVGSVGIIRSQVLQSKRTDCRVHGKAPIGHAAQQRRIDKPLQVIVDWSGGIRSSDRRRGNRLGHTL